MVQTHKKRSPRAAANSPPVLPDMGKLLYKSVKLTQIILDCSRSLDAQRQIVPILIQRKKMGKVPLESHFLSEELQVESFPGRLSVDEFLLCFVVLAFFSSF